MFVVVPGNAWRLPRPRGGLHRRPTWRLSLIHGSEDGQHALTSSGTARNAASPATSTTATATTARVANRGTAGSASFLEPRFQGRTGLILVNIGTPASLNVADVRRYLREFLGDDRVVDIRPKWLKTILLQVLLLTRPAKSAEAYANIWDKETGSPLLHYSQELATKIQKRVGNGYAVAVGMQFGEPNLVSVMHDFRRRGIDRMIIVPMFPQYASSTTGSASEMAYHTASKLYSTPYLHIVPAFYDHPAYIQAYANVIERVIGPRGSRRVDHLLLSFHGVPEKHCQQTDDTGLVCMQQEHCCSALVQANRNCYRAQCFATARALAQTLGLAPHEYSVSFQSRLTAAGPEWIKPYTDEVLTILPKQGVRRLAVAIPSFVTDCLETLEEIGMQGREEFLNAGGEEFYLVPCLNDSQEWADALLRIIEDSC
ncbi:ferrochelatase [Cyanidioschyzon merolae strain 10D]|jgi:ferrochelatase|uniref:Ferrochelatase n=1 Tax=Cyanidioschyzon merolae (strain NIES-3377 / 10D) TaxID=280699 RepID=M1VBI3_CYAM1|nr:ferrochelatase [Cyanidioschyzon merolae strain 10D]BAM82684.1 ferrochelatase [Cyanidioschyzon merolae strain 10D]|eukprot:XP_005538720.1 ferrochelatase [Cyanidioschyzon merolae strain 10D]